VPFKYDYAGGDPINRIDPTGMEDFHVTESMPGSSRTMNTPPLVITCVQSGGCTEGILVIGVRPDRPQETTVVGDIARDLNPPTPPPKIDGSGLQQRSVGSLGAGDTSREWRSGRYHERTAGLGNTRGSGTNYSGRTFDSKFKRNFVWRVKVTNQALFEWPGSLLRTAAGLLTGGAVSRSLGTVTPLQAMRSVVGPGLGPAGIATIGGTGATLAAAGVHIAVNAAVAGLALEIGIVAGAAVGATIDTYL
jgi:hypothetical protein